MALKSVLQAKSGTSAVLKCAYLELVFCTRTATEGVKKMCWRQKTCYMWSPTRKKAPPSIGGDLSV